MARERVKPDENLILDWGYKNHRRLVETKKTVENLKLNLAGVYYNARYLSCQIICTL
jgi:poly-gamma-glutamate capsule biosynthesis protein CapA/YwtB (metallophosphatase superfamily)